MAIALVGVVNSAQANPDPDPNVTALSNGIESFATRRQSERRALGEYGALANSLPLVDLSPGSPQALDLSNALKDAVNPALNDLGYDTLDDLKSALDGIDTTVGGVHVVVGTPTGTLDALAVPITLTRSVDQPLDFTAGIASIDRGSLDIDFTATTTLVPCRPGSGGIAAQRRRCARRPSGTPPKLNACAAVTTSVAAFDAARLHRHHRRHGRRGDDERLRRRDPQGPGLERVPDEGRVHEHPSRRLLMRTSSTARAPTSTRPSTSTLR